MNEQVIMARLAAIELRLAALEGGSGGARANGGGAPAAGAVADDADLDSKYGDVRIKYGLKVRYWKEQPDPHVGRLWSQCEPEYLDAAAKYLDACAFMARKDGDEKKAGYKERDAARCRGWAARIRGGWRPPPEPESAWGGGADTSASAGGFGDAGGFSGGASFGADVSDTDDSFDFGANVESDEEEKPL